MDKKDIRLKINPLNTNDIQTPPEFKNIKNSVSMDLKTDIKNNIKNEILKHKIELENKREDNELESCCGLRCDKRVSGLMNKTLIIFIVLLFSLLKIFITEEVSERNVYVNIVLLILGTAINKNENNTTKSKS